MSKLAAIALWLPLLAYFPVTMFFVRAEAAATTCQRIVATVHNDGRNVLMTNEGVLRLVKSDFPDLVGARLADINYDRLESTLRRSPVVRRCEAWPAAAGALHVEIYQRQPILRVFTSEGSYYMDSEGYQITARPGMHTHTLIVSGHANKLSDPERLLNLCRALHESDFYRAMIEQVYVTAQQEFLLVPRVGDHVVEFGGADRIEQKLDDLLTLYTKGWDKHEWNAYKSVSLKYDGQIICTKR